MSFCTASAAACATMAPSASREAYVELRPGLEGQEVELRFDPRDPSARPRVFLEDAFVCDTVPLDRVANASRRRRRLPAPAASEAEPSGLDPLALIEAEHYDRGRPLGQRPTTTRTNPNQTKKTDHQED